MTIDQFILYLIFRRLPLVFCVLIRKTKEIYGCYNPCGFILHLKKTSESNNLFLSDIKNVTYLYGNSRERLDD